MPTYLRIYLHTCIMHRPIYNLYLHTQSVYIRNTIHAYIQYTHTNLLTFLPYLHAYIHYMQIHNVYFTAPLKLGDERASNPRCRDWESPSRPRDQHTNTQYMPTHLHAMHAKHTYMQRLDCYVHVVTHVWGCRTVHVESMVPQSTKVT